VLTTAMLSVKLFNRVLFALFLLILDMMGVVFGRDRTSKRQHSHVLQMPISVIGLLYSAHPYSYTRI